ncbi:MAG: hypothetical protein IPQ09_08910 [Myxococcales bacterium]|nr:hypothetical protein [Myxococcales bacterium]HQY61623.1 hypothetical protein [Polyangiaceae bacterium]
MARIVRLTLRFRERMTPCGVRSGSPESAAIGATLAHLSDAATLPGMLDAIAVVPPTGQALVRRVPGRNLWPWFQVDGDDEVVRVVNLTRTPPVPRA